METLEPTVAEGEARLPELAAALPALREAAAAAQETYDAAAAAADLSGKQAAYEAAQSRANTAQSERDAAQAQVDAGMSAAGCATEDEWLATEPVAAKAAIDARDAAQVELDTANTALNAAQAEYSAAQTAVAPAKAALDAAMASQPEIQSRRQDITRLEDALRRYEQLDTLRAQAGAERKRLAQKRSDYDTARARTDAGAQALETARGKLREQPKLAVAAAQTGHAQEAAAQRCTQLAALEEQLGLNKPLFGAVRGMGACLCAGRFRHILQLSDARQRYDHGKDPGHACAYADGVCDHDGGFSPAGDFLCAA